jgi:hypothetical protein
MGFFGTPLPRRRRGGFLRAGERDGDDPERPRRRPSHIAARVRYIAARRGARRGVSSSFAKDSASVACSRSLAEPIAEPDSASASASEAMPESGAGWRRVCAGSSGSDAKSSSESTSDAPSMDWTSESEEGRSDSWDACEEKSRSVVGGVASVARTAGSGRVTFGRKICVRR